MIYSKACEYAIRALAYLARPDAKPHARAKEIARSENLPLPVLGKILQGLVRAFRGPGGGVELGRSPEAITLAALVHAVEGDVTGEDCALGLGECSEVAPCRVHARWAPLRSEFRRLLEETSLDTQADSEEVRRAWNSAPMANTRHSTLKG